jgi:hypothetical protein
LGDVVVGRGGERVAEDGECCGFADHGTKCAGGVQGDRRVGQKVFELGPGVNSLGGTEPGSVERALYYARKLTT